ncbi:MAG: hypothetical protein LBD41_03315, partial [Clostridiales Family XIII bacterium]|nr:hypothetical protein [Clostridiales Family XIII bacterium]
MKAKAFAKVNLSLEIKGKNDNGYHFIDSFMQLIDLSDEISLKIISEKELKIKNDNCSLFIRNSFLNVFNFSGILFSIEGSAELLDENNLCIKAIYKSLEFLNQKKYRQKEKKMIII